MKLALTHKRLGASLFCSVVAFGCGGAASGGAFHASYGDNDPSSLAGAMARISARAGNADSTSAVAVSSDGQHLIGFDATTGARRYRVDIRTEYPVVTSGSYTLVEETDNLRVLDATNGTERLRVELGTGFERQHLIGADADDGFLAISLSTATGSTARSRLVLVRGSNVVADIPLDRPLGIPAVAGDTVLVPWAYQYLSVLDRSGRELSRVRLRNGIVGHAVAQDGHVWFGGPRLYRLDARSATELPEGYAPPNLGIDRPPTLMSNAYEPPTALTSAAHHVRMAFAVDRASSVPALADGILYFLFYRFVFALDATNGTPRWVRSVPADVVGATAFPGGIRVASESGDIFTFGATDGRAFASALVGEPIAYAAYPRVESVTLGAPVEAERPDVRVQLMGAVQTPDARLVTAREFALARLAALTDDDATSDLTLLCEDERLPPRTKQRACDLLATRPVGSEHILSQLQRHGSFLDESVAPPVRALARAAGNMRIQASVPLLVEQLNDPRTRIEAIAAIASALQAIGDTSAAIPLLDFLRRYHADTSEEGMVDALGAVAFAYGVLGGADAIAEIDSLAGDPLAPNPMVRVLRDALVRVRNERDSAHPATTTNTPVNVTAEVAAPVPTHLTLAVAGPEIEGARRELVACLQADPSRPNSVRIITMVERNGAVREVHTSPESTEECIRAVMLARRFPETRGVGAERLTFTVRSH